MAESKKKPKGKKKPLVILFPKGRGKFTRAEIRRAVREVAAEREQREKQKVSDGKE